MDICYLVINDRYLHEHGIVRSYRFARYFFCIDDVLTYLYKVPNCDEFRVITISDKDYEMLKKRKDVEVCL